MPESTEMDFTTSVITVNSLVLEKAVGQIGCTGYEPLENLLISWWDFQPFEPGW
jgi:hypothetical protein